MTNCQDTKVLERFCKKKFISISPFLARVYLELCLDSDIEPLRSAFWLFIFIFPTIRNEVVNPKKVFLYNLPYDR